MLKDRVFIISLIISLLVHLIMLSSWKSFRFTKKKMTVSSPILHIAYYKIKQEIEKIDQMKAKAGEIKTELETEQIKPKRKSKSSKIKKNADKTKQEKIIVKKEDFQKKDSVGNKTKDNIKIDVKEKPVNLTSLNFDKVDSFSKKPAFIDYYRAIREKIKETAQALRPEFFNQGQVSLTFKLTCDGGLVRTKIIDEISSKDKLLREIALNSVSGASPFPPFPKELERTEIDFIITISFKPY